MFTHNSLSGQNGQRITVVTNKYIVKMVIYPLDHHRSIQFLLSSLINLIGDEPVPCVDTLFIWLGPTPKHTSLLVEAFPIEKAPVPVP